MLRFFLITIFCFIIKAEKIIEDYNFTAAQHDFVKGYRQNDGSYDFRVTRNDFLLRTDAYLVASVATIPDDKKIGWYVQHVTSSPNFNDSIQAYWAGYLEGIAVGNLTRAHWLNTYSNYCKRPYSTFCTKLRTYLLANLQWMKSQILQKRMTEPFWHQIEVQLWQIKGLEDAFVGKRPVSNSKQLSIAAFNQMEIDPFSIYLLQVSGDLEDLESAFGKNGRTVSQPGNGKCSALIKLLPGNTDLFTSHDTWNQYSAMLRVLKRYDLPFRMTAHPNSPRIPGYQMSLSSYPSLASSGDDFYIMKTGLVAIETTNGNYNSSLWNIVRNSARSSVLEFLRVQVANRMATNGSQWVQYFAYLNSGTYNNQWMVVDYNKFIAKRPLQKGLLTVAEQLPGMVYYQDLTSVLQNNRYWGSYNIPAFKIIYDTSGFPAKAKQYGPWFTHEGSPRAKIFKRDHSKVTNVYSMMRLMRYNNFQKDPLSRCSCQPPYSAENTISSRSDLNPANGRFPFAALGHRAHGGTDMKLTNSTMMRALNFVAINGPTYDQVPPFQWSKSDFNKTMPHFMHPDIFKFPPILTNFH